MNSRNYFALATYTIGIVMSIGALIASCDVIYDRNGQESATVRMLQESKLSQLTTQPAENAESRGEKLK